MWPGLGDCLLAYFGCPRAREDKVEGRCLALELVEAIALLEAHPEVRRQARSAPRPLLGGPILRPLCSLERPRARLSVNCRGRVPAVGSGKHRSDQGIEIPFYRGVGAS
jgi:hypothetical protein